MNEFCEVIANRTKEKVHTYMTRKPAHKKKYTTTSRSRNNMNKKKEQQQSKQSALDFFLCVCFGEKKRVCWIFIFKNDKKKV
jgi:hypothetical protein